MKLGLRDKPVLVMAASSGMGKATALEFSREGADVMLFSRSEDRLRAACDEIEGATGRRPSYSVGDISRAEDIHQAVSDTVRRFGGLFALANNSGGPPPGKFMSFTDDHWQIAFELTLLGYVRSIREAVAEMKKNGGGRIVNFTSSSTRQAIDNLVLSNAFRMGVVGLTKTLARELGQDGILVNVIGPGKIETERLLSLNRARAENAGISPEQVKADAVKDIPLGRYGHPEEIAKAAVFLCSEANTYISGQTILVDGGAVRAY